MFDSKNCSVKILHYRIGCIGLISMDKTFPSVIILLATCDHPPGTILNLINLCFFFINLNLSLSSISLKAALDLYPKVFDFLKN